MEFPDVTTGEGNWAVLKLLPELENRVLSFLNPMWQQRRVLLPVDRSVQGQRTALQRHNIKETLFKGIAMKFLFILKTYGIPKNMLSQI